MEIICLRFPLIANQVLKNVDNQTLINYRECGWKSSNFINGEKFYWFRILHKYWLIVDIQGHGWQMQGLFYEYWQKIMKNTPLEIVKKLAMASIQFSRTFPQEKIRDWSPFHLAAASGDLKLYKWIEEKCEKLSVFECSTSVGDINSQLHLSADNGSLEIIKYLLRKLVIKNPGNKKGGYSTPLCCKKWPF